MRPLHEDAWNAWTPEYLHQRLHGVAQRWYVVGGWALDLWHGRITRPHEDLEFAVLAQQVDRFRTTLTELAFFYPENGELTHLSSDADVPGHAWQLWGAQYALGCWRVDMMLERGQGEDEGEGEGKGKGKGKGESMGGGEGKGEGDVWTYKRDPAITQPLRAAIWRTASGIPYLAPANVLLFKAKHCRPKDDDDFALALPKLSLADQSRLKAWLEKLHPGHKWISSLANAR